MPNNLRWKRFLVPLGVIFVFVLLLGRGGRGEFCPQTLEMRTYSLGIIRGTNLVVYESKAEVHTPAISTFLIKEGYWTRSKETETAIFAFHWSDLGCRANDYWYREFVRKDEEWISWTKENPEWAKVFWSQMLTTLREPDTSPYHYSELLYAKRHTTTLDGYLDELNSIRR